MSLFILVILIIDFGRIQSDEILFQCTLDENDLCRLRSFDNGEEMIVDSGSEILSSDNPIQPWSDVSSILKSTRNGYQCQIPYRKESNSNDLYFCSNSSNSINCLTTNGSEDQCQQGKYHLLLLGNNERRQFITPKIMNNYLNGTCLTFYYYLTKPNIVLLFTDYLTEEGEQKLINGFIDVPFNGWHLKQESFKINSRSFRIIFRIFRADMSNPSQPFYVAFDQITLNEGDCGSTLPPYQQFNDTFFSTKSIDEITSSFDSDDTTLRTTSSLLITNRSSIEQIQDLTKQSETTIETNQITNNDEINSTFSVTTTTIPTNHRNQTTTTTDKSPFQYSSTTVIALSIGLGIPAALGVLLTSIYLIKLIQKRKTKVNPFKQTQIYLKRRHPHRHRHRHHHRHHQERKRENLV